MQHPYFFCRVNSHSWIRPAIIERKMTVSAKQHGRMNTFQEWMNTEKHRACWGERLSKLGVSWDTFRRDNHNDITADLIQGGIPPLVASDIVDMACKEVQRDTMPMAIFWDLENMPIPNGGCARSIASRLKTVLNPFGSLRQCRAYASIGHNLIPLGKRSELQLSGWHLVDCPHNGRKDVADKMMIVDAMQFAYENLNGATLCFVTADLDYAYLLAVLNRYPQWRTVVVSSGVIPSSMLHQNCDWAIQWESDILQSVDTSIGSYGSTTDDNFPREDLEMLCTVMHQLSKRKGSKMHLKGDVGIELRKIYPLRFTTPNEHKSFLQRAIQEGIVMEQANKSIRKLVLAEQYQSLISL